MGQVQKMPILINPERDLIVGTISDIEDSVDDLEMRIGMMTDDLKAKQARLALWRKRLADIDGVPITGGPTASQRRQPKGANLRAVVACLENAISGLTAAEIRYRTGLAWSSVQRVLSQHNDQFFELNGLWKLRPKSPRPMLGTKDARSSQSEAGGSQELDQGEHGSDHGDSTAPDQDEALDEFNTDRFGDLSEEEQS